MYFFNKFQSNLKVLPDIIIPARLTKKTSNFSSVGWDSTSPSDSDVTSPLAKNLQHEAIIHKPNNDSSIESEKESSNNLDEGIYEIIRDENKDQLTFTTVDKCYASGDECDLQSISKLHYNNLKNKDYPTSACSTPISKVPRVKTLGTPGADFHRSDSTEYCSILSPNRTNNLVRNDSENQSSVAEASSAKLSRSFTPKSYKPLHIKVPEFGNLECIKSLRKNRNESNATYSFDIKNYSLPNTPIARSNKLRKNAWLSGEFTGEEKRHQTTSDAQDKGING